MPFCGGLVDSKAFSLCQTSLKAVELLEVAVSFACALGLMSDSQRRGAVPRLWTSYATLIWLHGSQRLEWYLQPFDLLGLRASRLQHVFNTLRK